jgi:hypothetical protein
MSRPSEAKAPAIYGEARIRERARVIGLPSAAALPRGKAFAYAPHLASGESYPWDAAAKAGQGRDEAL